MHRSDPTPQTPPSESALTPPAPPHPALTTRFDPPAGGEPGELELTGRLLSASNATFAAELRPPGRAPISCVYKPVAGEQPLWDFPGRVLGRREVAAYELSASAGFDLVPYTAWVDGPYGEGSLQVWVDDDTDDVVVDLVPSEAVTPSEETSLVRYDGRDWHHVLDGIDGADREVSLLHAEDPRLRSMALFDAVINNADRKGGHILASQGRLFGVDHGISFHPEPKLRTLLWGWADEPFTAAERDQLRRVAALADVLHDLLGDEDTEALAQRVDRLLARGAFPSPHRRRHVIPWPPW